MIDVMEDLVMDWEEIEETSPENPKKLAELKKENGNHFFKIKQYSQALAFYTEAIELCQETASYYGNRSACYIMLNNFHAGLEDARKAVQLDHLYLKGYQRIAKCSLALGDVMTADQAIKKLQELDSTNTSTYKIMKTLEILRQYELEAMKAEEKKDYRKIVYCMDRCLNQVPNCSRYKIQKAECLAVLGRYQEAEELANDILHENRGNADALYVLGLCLFYKDNIDTAQNHFQQVLRLAFDHKKATEAYKRAKTLKKMKYEGNEAFKSCKFQKAIDFYTEALRVDLYNKKTNAKLYVNRAKAYSRLTKYKEAIADCTAALNLDETCVKALLRRAKCYMDLSKFEDAVRDYDKVLKMNHSKLRDAKVALKKSKGKDYYKILGVDHFATDDEIKKAYRKKVLVHHPDKHSNASENEKKEQEKKFKEVGEAYGILSDRKKKLRYDNGQDRVDYDVRRSRKRRKM